MPQYTIQTEHTSIFGMDVHARSVVVKGFDWSTGEEKSRRFGDCPSAAEIAEWMRAEFAPTYYAAYESGYTGFQLCRDLRALGIDCDVVAVSTIARSDDDRKRKTDRKDASRLLSEMLSPKKGKFSVVWVPDEECEAVRDLVRARDDAVEALKRSKQQTTAALTRHGLTWNERTPTGNLKSMWTKAFMAWAKKADLGQESANRTLALYIEWVERNAERVEEVSKATLAVSLQPRWKPYVDALCLLKGIDRQTALLLAAEIGDFSRFANGRSVSKWLGTIPSENSSDEHVAHGKITKDGNSHCRRALVEGVQCMSRVCGSAKKPAKGCEVSPAVAAHCRKANKRLKERYDHLVCEQKIGSNKAKVAVASEMIRWVWAVGLMVQRELAAGEAASRPLDS